MIIMIIIIIIIIYYYYYYYYNLPEAKKYWVDVQWGIVSSHGVRDLL